MEEAAALSNKVGIIARKMLGAFSGRADWRVSDYVAKLSAQPTHYRLASRSTRCTFRAGRLTTSDVPTRSSVEYQARGARMTLPRVSRSLSAPKEGCRSRTCSNFSAPTKASSSSMRWSGQAWRVFSSKSSGRTTSRRRTRYGLDLGLHGSDECYRHPSLVVYFLDVPHTLSIVSIIIQVSRCSGQLTLSGHVQRISVTADHPKTSRQQLGSVSRLFSESQSASQTAWPLQLPPLRLVCCNINAGDAA